MEARLVRYKDLIPCRSAFIDTRTPGSQQKENFTVIGPGVAENPEQHVHIGEPHGFNIGAARQPPGCVNSQHSHETAEVFIVHSGRWGFHLGADANDGTVEIGPGDIISIPIHVFRGFSNIGDETGFMFAVLGGDDPGRVTWAPYVFDQAQAHGLVLLESGRLIDTAKGEAIPVDANPMPPTTAEDVAALRQMTGEDLEKCVVREADIGTIECHPLEQCPGLFEAPLIGADSDPDRLPAGRMDWSHGFHVRRLRLASGASTPVFRREEPEVLMLHRGEMVIDCDDTQITLRAGDTFTTPVNSPRRYTNTQTQDALAFVVRGTDHPAGYR
ncbi:MAG: cupin domain-containing protein [Pseudomonadota bacterium]